MIGGRVGSRGMLLLTGATGTIGAALLRRLTVRGEPVRCLVRDPRRLGPARVRVQIALGDLADPPSFRHALRGVDTVVHLAGSIRDQPRGSIEELNGVATWRMVHAAERAGVRALRVLLHHRRLDLQPVAPAPGEGAGRARGGRVRASPHDLRPVDRLRAPATRTCACSSASRCCSRFPLPGRGRALAQPIWADDVAECVMAVLDGREAGDGARFELAGPDTLSHEAIVRLALRSFGRSRAIVKVPLPLVPRAHGHGRDARRPGGLRDLATRSQLLQIPMTARHGHRGRRAPRGHPRADGGGARSAARPCAPPGPATSVSAITRSGVMRTSSSSGTALRRPYSSARSSPM